MFQYPLLLLNLHYPRQEFSEAELLGPFRGRGCVLVWPYRDWVLYTLKALNRFLFLSPECVT